MLKLADGKLSAYKGDYKPVEIYKNNKKIYGYKIMGLSGTDASFKNTYNAPMTMYGKSGYYQGKNLCPPPINMSGDYSDGTETYNWCVTAKEDGRFDVSGAMINGVQISKTTLNAGTYAVSGCEIVSLWWNGLDGFLTIPNTFTLEEQTEVLCVLWHTDTEQISLTDQYIQIEKSSRSTTYEAFRGNSQLPPSPDNKMQLEASEGTITISCLGGIKYERYSIDIPKLAGLEVSSADRYNYNEGSGTAKYYFLSDFLSGSVLKRNIGKLKLSGEENFLQKDIQSTTHNCYYCDLSHIITRNRMADVCMCNCFETKDELITNETGIVLGENDTNLYFIVDKKAFSTLDEFVQWIADQYTTSPVTIHYILDSEISENWTQSPFVSFPQQTKIDVAYKSKYPKSGLTKSILIKDS